MKYRVIIFTNEIEGDSLGWETACQESDKVDYKIVNVNQLNWLDEIQKFNPDIVLTKPGAVSSLHKQLYDEKLYVLSKLFNFKIFPSPEEVFVYENKRLLSFWLKANNIPHPRTKVFYSYNQALSYALSEDKIVAKINIGASGRGVKIMKDEKEKITYLKNAFHGDGVGSSFGPNLAKGNFLKRLINNLKNPENLKKRLKIYKSVKRQKQSGFVILQEFVPHQFEWRVVRIGDSFFAHKKLLKNDKASGSLLKGYAPPPLELLDFVKQVTDTQQFYSQAVDVFESNRGYLVNEMQCIFGQSDPYQMLIEGKPGRYIFQNKKWIFEAGDFARNACYDLRLEYIIKNLRNRK
ncbi:MAG: hypothetical protein JXP36_20340 [Bacteroidales bacterium]|nr:hypothetical protein [Bacteroidales bacterium]